MTALAVVVLAGLAVPRCQDPGDVLTVVVWGDSAAAWSEEGEPPWPAGLERRLGAAGVRAWVVNASLGGRTSASAADAYQEEALVHRPEVVVLACGTDDERSDPPLEPAATVRHLRRMLAETREAGAAPVLVLPAGGDGTQAARAAACRELARQEAVPTVAGGGDPAPEVAAVVADLIADGRIRPWPLLAPRVRGPERVVVADGVARDLRGGGREEEFRAPWLLGAGDFRLRARLVLARFEHTAAALRLGDSWFGFDGRNRRLFTAGPLFGGRTVLRRPALEILAPGRPFTVEVVRRGAHLRVALDGRPVAAGVARGPVGGCAFRPQRGDLRVLDFRLAGDLERIPEPPPRGWTIPWVDLAGEKEHQVVVDREPGRYLGHPTTVLLDDGRTILCVYPEGHGRGAIRYRRSPDGGRTWSRLLPVPSSWSTSREVPTIYKVHPRGGGTRLLLFSGLYPIRMARSEDEGRTWTELEPIGDYGGIVAMASLVEVPGGDLLAFFHDDGRFLHGEGRPGRFRVFAVRSTDGGLHWGPPRVVAEHPDAHLCEPGAVWSPDGRVLALLLRENSRRHNSYVVFSDDGGRSWSLPRELPGALTGDRHTARYAPDGRLVVTFRDTCLDSPTQGDWVAWVGAWEDLREGREGRYRVRLMDNHHAWDCAYPGLEVLPDGTFVATTYGHWTEGEPPWIVSVRFRMEELDERVEAAGD